MKKRNTAKTKLVATIISMVCALSLLAVGVMASLTNFQVAIANQLNLKFDAVEGTLYATRVGDVAGTDRTTSKVLSESTTATDWLKVYDGTTTEGVQNDALTSIQEKVDFVSNDKIKEKVNAGTTSIAITYYFYYTLPTGSVNNKITLSAPAVTDTNVEIVYSYVKTANSTLPDFSAATEILDGNRVVVSAGEQVFIKAEARVSLNKSVKIENADWNFTLNFGLPAANEIDGTSISMDTVEGATTYEIWAKEATSANTGLLSVSEVGDTDASLGECIWAGYEAPTSLNLAQILDKATEYAITMVAKDDASTTLQSKTVVVQNEKVLPQLSTPIVSGVSNGLYSWEVVENATAYELWKGTDHHEGYKYYKTLTSTQLEVVASGGKFDEVSTFEQGYYHVRAIADGYRASEFNQYFTAKYRRYSNYFERFVCCFVAGSKISMADGSYKNIEDIVVGDKVLSINEDTGEKIVTTVNSLATNPSSVNMAKVYFEDQTMVDMTDYHPLYTITGWKSITGYMGYEKLVVGDKVKTENGYKTITKIEQYKLAEPITTYNFGVTSDEVVNCHNYFVNDTLAHNAGCIIATWGISYELQKVTISVTKDSGNVNLDVTVNLAHRFVFSASATYSTDTLFTVAINDVLVGKIFAEYYMTSVWPELFFGSTPYGDDKYSILYNSIPSEIADGGTESEIAELVTLWEEETSGFMPYITCNDYIKSFFFDTTGKKKVGEINEGTYTIEFGTIPEYSE